MTGEFSVQEYIQELIRSDPANIVKICEPPKGADLAVWQYEHLRQFVLELNLLVVQLQGICNAKSCPKMKATEEWLYLCACHPTTQECPAIDYMIHTLDYAASLLTNTKYFPSRTSIPPGSSKHMVSLVRRLYRLFAHTYYNHQEIFTEFENEMHLCERFTEFASRFDMMPPKLFCISLFNHRVRKGKE